MLENPALIVKATVDNNKLGLQPVLAVRHELEMIVDRVAVHGDHVAVNLVFFENIQLFPET